VDANQISSIFRRNASEPTEPRDIPPRMPSATPRRRRARPVADAPIDSLLLRSEDLTKGWLLALLEQAPLDDAPDILAADIAREGPRVCDAVLRAIANETDLRRLEPGGALRPLAGRVGELSGAVTPAAASRAVDALQAVLWTAVRDELRSPDPDMVSELTERLTLISELLRNASLERPATREGGGGPAPVLRPVGAPEPGADPGPSPAPHQPYRAPFDEPPSDDPPAPPPPAATVRPVRPSMWPDDAERAVAQPADALWVGALEDEIRHSSGSPLALLLAELEDADRVTAVEPAPEATATFTRFAGAVRSAVRRQDILVCESEARAWIIARETARPGAYALGERIAEAVRGAEAWHGVPLTASVGVAVLGEDGRTSAELIDAAEEARYAAEASGLQVIREQSPDED
jgi:GGDEF domain-containing protein